jgi:hypothetical protein
VTLPSRLDHIDDVFDVNDSDDIVIARSGARVRRAIPQEEGGKNLVQRKFCQKNDH